MVDDLRKAGEEINREGSDAFEKLIEERLDDYKLEKQSIEYFKEKLAEFSAAQEKPIIVLIDELDRCRPTFAVQMIEREASSPAGFGFDWTQVAVMVWVNVAILLLLLTF